MEKCDSLSKENSSNIEQIWYQSAAKSKLQKLFCEQQESLQNGIFWPFG